MGSEMCIRDRDRETKKAEFGPCLAASADAAMGWLGIARKECLGVVEDDER